MRNPLTLFGTIMFKTHSLEFLLALQKRLYMKPSKKRASMRIKQQVLKILCISFLPKVITILLEDIIGKC